MTTTAPAAARVRSQIDHPIIDSDGHFIEIDPVIVDYVRDVGGPQLADRYRQHMSDIIGATIFGQGLDMAVADRADAWLGKPSWWNITADTLDRATSMLPKLMSERLEEIGIDFMVAYPSSGLLNLATQDDELRPVACRAFNKYYMDLLSAYSHQMTPVAIIPMQTPDEALAELQHAVVELGYKACVFQESAGRPVPKLLRDAPQAAALAQRPDWFGSDSAYDYDPVWARCVELGVAVTFHGQGTTSNFLSPASISNHLFSRHVLVASLHRPSVASIFFGGVSRRFPTLKFAWLETGVAWACDMVGQIVGQWEKRGGHAIQNLNPNRLDRQRLYKLIEEYGDTRTLAALPDVRAFYDRDFPAPPVVNEFEVCGMESAGDIVKLFADNFFFGCEGDDRSYPWAFASDHFPVDMTLKVIYGSDVSHWDVPDMAEVLHEAHEGVEHGLVTPEQFREFAFGNAIRLHAGMNPDFFKGTTVEGAVADYMEKM